jgi:hypothetical protein
MKQSSENIVTRYTRFGVNAPQVLLGAGLDRNDFDAMRTGGANQLLDAPEFIHRERMLRLKRVKIIPMIKAAHGEAANDAMNPAQRNRPAPRK